jgi:hypothetical protein
VKRVLLNLELLEQPWVRDLFEVFCAWEQLKKTAGNMTSRIDRYAIFFSVIDQSFATPADINQHRLVEIFGADGLRKSYVVISFLVRRLTLPWSAETTIELVEKRRISELLDKWKSRTWSNYLSGYVEWLADCQSVPLSLKTIRTYTNAAGRMLDYASIESAGDISQEVLERFIRHHPGQRASLSSFVRFLHECCGAMCINPKKKAASSLAVERRKIAEVKSLVVRLDSCTKPEEMRALLARLIARLYAIPLARVLALTVDEVGNDGGVVVLWPGSLSVRLESRIGDIFVRHVHFYGGSKYVFDGRNGIQPLTYDAVRHYLHT